ncbi:GAF domain-containing protein [Ligilactobacillus agilis]|uniref:GAF domain-containing protein n=1 Tax=Ligilactobacillus agilis TaxID=1601 RepID=UPI00265D261E|nr:GAF domain-containing protein [Ligilactobacillus agilis]
MTQSLLAQQIDALLTGETNQMANLANASALLNDSLTDINWVGFYLYQSDANELILGPFQGKVACMHIKVGQGVCGTAFANKEVLRVANVHEFAGHIACDSASNSEIVLPLHNAAGDLIGVLDIDSPSLDRFSQADEAVLAEFEQALAKHL